MCKSAFIAMFALVSVLTVQTAHAQWRPGTVIFEIPSLPQDQINTVIETLDLNSSKNGDEKSYSINIPIKQVDGSYVPVKFSYSESSNQRSLTIPGRGNISIIKDSNGDYAIELTPDQIKSANNISCSIGLTGKGKCTISPFVKIVGDKIINADKLVVDYTEGENLKVVSGKATNFKLNAPGATTEAGDTEIGVKFNSADNKSFEVGLDTGKLTHTVTNSNNPTQTGTKFQVKDSGVKTSLIIDRDESVRVKLNAETKGGVKYDSNPFSDKKVTIDTSSPVKGTITLVENNKKPKGEITLSSSGAINIVDTSAKDTKKVIKANGETFVKATQLTDDSKGLASISLVSDELSIQTEGKKKNEMEVLRLHGAALVDKKSGTTTANMHADLVKQKSTRPDGKSRAIEIENAEMAFKETDVFKLYEVYGDKAYYNNGETEIHSEGLTALEKTYKDLSLAETLNGRPIKKEVTFFGQGAQFITKAGTAELSGKMIGKQVELDNKEKYLLVNGTNAKIKTDKYDGALDTGYQIIFHEGPDGTSYSQIDASDINAKDDENSYQILHSNTTREVLGKTSDGQKVISTQHTSRSIISNQSSINKLDISYIDGNTLKYGDVKFDNLVHKDQKKNEEFRITGARALLYSDETNPNNKITEGNIEVSKISTIRQNDVIEILAKDAQGREGKFKVYAYENGTSKNYKIFAEDGKQVFLETTDKDNKHARVVLQAIDYLESPEFKQVYAEKLQGRLETIDGQSTKLQEFTFGQLGGTQTATNTQLGILNGRVAQNESGKKESGLAFDSLQYAQTKELVGSPEIQQFHIENVRGKIESRNAQNSKIQEVSFKEIGGVQSGKSTQAGILNGRISQVDPEKGESVVKFESLQFSQSSHLDEKDLRGQMLNGVINHVEVSGDKKTKEANLTIGSLLINQQKNGSKSISMISINDIDLIAVDHDALMKASGKIGSINQLKSPEIQTLEINNVKDLKIEDLAKGNSALLNSDKIVRVVQKDADGNEIGSYLLMKSTVLTANEVENNVNANIRIGVLELIRDKAQNQNIILDADFDGKIRVEKGKSPVGGEVNFALKGKNITTEKQSFVSADGKTVGNYFAIKPVDEKGRLDKLKLSAGPDFLKEAISLEAKGGENGGKTLSFSFQQDKGNGTYYVRAEFKEGDKVKVKLFPFTLESKNENGDAVAELMLTAKGQNFFNHLEIISQVVDAREITDWLNISHGGMLVARTGSVGGFGFEMMYQNEKYFNPADRLENSMGVDKAATYGLGMYHENDKGDRLSGGLMLSGDSEFEYQTNGRGVLKIFGQDMNASGSIPATINLYLKKEWASGDSLYGGVFVDTASMAVDKNQINKDAAFFSNGRGPGGVGASVAYSKKLSEASRLTVAAGANNNMEDPGVCITYTVMLGAPANLASDMVKVTNEIAQETKTPPPVFSDPGPSLQNAITQLRYDVKKLEAEKEEALALERILDKLTEAQRNPRALAEISEADFNKLKQLENGGNITPTLQNLIYAARQPSVTMDVAAIRSTLNKLAKKYEDTNSDDIHQLYLEKYKELVNLTGKQ